MIEFEGDARLLSPLYFGVSLAEGVLVARASSFDATTGVGEPSVTTNVRVAFTSAGDCALSTPVSVSRAKPSGNVGETVHLRGITTGPVTCSLT